MTSGMERWAGRVALVTGGTKGIGRAITQLLLQHGMKVVICARKVDNVQGLSDIKKGEVFPIACNLGSETQVLDMFNEIRAKFGHLDVCINNAGVLSEGNLISGDFKNWKNMVDVNVLGLSLCTREAIKLMRDNGIDDGHIIHINSVAGHTIAPSKYTHFYSATKHAVKALTEGLRLELVELKSNIKISSVSPGFVKTNLTADMWGEEKLRQIQSSIPVLSPEEVAQNVIHVLQTPPNVQVEVVTG